MGGRTVLEEAATETGVEIVASLAQHRVLSADQVRTIHLPGATRRWAQRLLARLGRAGLAGYVRSPRSHRRLWHVTEKGARVAKEAGLLDGEPRLIGAEGAAGPLQAHTLAVNDAGICFLEAAPFAGRRARAVRVAPRGRPPALAWARAPSARSGRRRRPHLPAPGP
jgi:hypothetical protein